jgi:putative membrane protein
MGVGHGTHDAVLVVVLGIIIWLIFQLIGRGRSPGSEAGRGRAEEILNERHARGEIDRETYQRMLEDLRGGPPS